MEIERVENPPPFFACPDFSYFIDPLIERIQMIWDALLDLLSICFDIDDGYDDDEEPLAGRIVPLNLGDPQGIKPETELPITDDHESKGKNDIPQIKELLPLRNLCIETLLKTPLPETASLPADPAEYMLQLSLIKGLPIQENHRIPLEYARTLHLPNTAVNISHLNQILAHCKNLELVSFKKIQTAEQYLSLLKFFISKKKDYPHLRLLLEVKLYSKDSLVTFDKIMKVITLDTCVPFFQMIKEDLQTVDSLLYFFRYNKNDERWIAVAQNFEAFHYKNHFQLSQYIPLIVIHRLWMSDKISTIIENIHPFDLTHLYQRINSTEWSNSVEEPPSRELIRLILFCLINHNNDVIIGKNDYEIKSDTRKNNLLSSLVETDHKLAKLLIQKVNSDEENKDMDDEMKELENQQKLLEEEYNAPAPPFTLQTFIFRERLQKNFFALYEASSRSSLPVLVDLLSVPCFGLLVEKIASREKVSDLLELHRLHGDNPLEEKLEKAKVASELFPEEV